MYRSYNRICSRKTYAQF